MSIWNYCNWIDVKTKKIGVGYYVEEGLLGCLRQFFYYCMAPYEFFLRRIPVLRFFYLSAGHKPIFMHLLRYRMQSYEATSTKPKFKILPPCRPLTFRSTIQSATRRSSE